jgi:hypothetical protein
MSEAQYRHEEVAAVPSGWRVRTVTHSSGHRARIAFPPGRRRKGAGKLVSILHPRSEHNPCEVNPAELIIVGANPSVGANPASAEQLYEEFHGAPARRETEYEEPSAPRETLTELGDMILLTLLRVRGYKWGEIDFAGCGVKLASNAKGTQISLVGGDQSLTRGTITDLGGDNSKDLVDLGEALIIEYRTKKKLAGGIPANYEHNFGEESGRRPQVMYDQRTKRIQFVGGEYTVAAPGIIN